MKATSQGKSVIRKELWVWAALIALANIPLLFGAPCRTLIFVPELLAAGEWWRALTGFFVHVSWYHLLLDASTFLMLVESLHTIPRIHRLLIVVACGVGSLGVSMPVIGSSGTLCGLSGIAHGLLAVLALTMVEEGDKTLRQVGAVCFLMVVAKCIFEAATGGVLFADLHLGNVATPVAICHAGGVLGGLIAYGCRF
jgi:rhomboid family GlyGly-CTERM serine protease